MIAKLPESLKEQDSLGPDGTFQAPENDMGVLLDNNGREFKVPDYTINQLRKAIPKHCYERSMIRGFSYVFRDIALLAVTFYIFNTYATPEYVPSYNARFALWTLYTVLQGLFATGLWVLAHECGHQAFSTSKRVNDTTGWFLHSALLVPYFSWKISHGKHHKGIGNMERDMVFLPKTRQEYADRKKVDIDHLAHLAEDSPLYTLGYTIVKQLFGWPLYLLTNRTGHDFHERQREGRGKGKHNGWKDGVNHFNPNSPIFEARDAKYIIISDIGVAITATILYLLGQAYGSKNVIVWYVLPYLWVNHWLIAVTFLQHTDPSLPHYDNETWTFVRGAAVTIDREFGFIGRTLFHGIIETHVLHHYVSTIPFYHAYEATEAIKPIMGEHYRSSTAGGAWQFVPNLLRVLRACQWVEPSEGARGEGRGVFFFRNRNRVGVPPVESVKFD